MNVQRNGFGRLIAVFFLFFLRHFCFFLVPCPEWEFRGSRRRNCGAALKMWGQQWNKYLVLKRELFPLGIQSSSWALAYGSRAYFLPVWNRMGEEKPSVCVFSAPHISCFVIPFLHHCPVVGIQLQHITFFLDLKSVQVFYLAVAISTTERKANYLWAEVTQCNLMLIPCFFWGSGEGIEGMFIYELKSWHCIAWWVWVWKINLMVSLCLS